MLSEQRIWVGDMKDSNQKSATLHSLPLLCHNVCHALPPSHWSISESHPASRLEAGGSGRCIDNCEAAESRAAVSGNG